MKKIFIIGSFGYKNNIVGGQTIKTRNILKILKTKYSVSFFDTEDIKGNYLLILVLLMKTIFAKNIVFVGGQANLKLFFPVLYFVSKIRRSSIVYVTVGGWLYDFLLENSTAYSFMLRNIKSILVETRFLQENLKAIEFKNVDQIPNFRIPCQYSLRATENNDELKIVFMARIVREKGIYLLFDLIDLLVSQNIQLAKKVSITFYGPIGESERGKFQQLTEKYSKNTSYGGILKPEDIYHELTNFDVLVLPTFHPWDGFPGTILDAYLCGLPVIVTRWKQIPEFVDDSETGFLIDYKVEELLSKVKLLSNDRVLLREMKLKAYIKSREYSAEVGLEVLNKAMF